MTENLEDNVKAKPLTKEEAIGGMCTAVSHYVKNVLTGIVGNIQLAEYKGNATEYHKALEAPANKLSSLLEMIHEHVYPVHEYPSQHLREGIQYMRELNTAFHNIPAHAVEQKFYEKMKTSIESLQKFINAWDVAEQVAIADPRLHTTTDYLPGEPMVDIAKFIPRE